MAVVDAAPAEAEAEAEAEEVEAAGEGGSVEATSKNAPEQRK